MMKLDEARERARSKAAAVARVLASEDGKVTLDVMTSMVQELRASIRPEPGAPNDAGQALIVEGAQRQIDNLHYYANAAEVVTNG